ncbi:MAG TPA: hypothetical protein VFF17_05885 [Thermoanaerobaculia bacterium]|nr:hypothetical protein [Thermoanaerobaculia bacterium]
MKALALGNRRQAMLFGGLVLVLVFAVVKWSGRDPDAAPPVAPPPASADADEARPAIGRRPRPRAAQPEEVPLITARDLEPLVGGGGGGTGRDLFDFREPTPRPSPVPTPAPPPPPAPGQPAFVGPVPPPGPTPTPVAPDPPFKLIGIFGSKEQPIAVLETGDNNTHNARAGDVILRRWIIRRVGYESIDVGFVGYPETETRRLAIAQ